MTQKPTLTSVFSVITKVCSIICSSKGKTELNTNQASDLEGIPALLLKKCASELAPVLTDYFKL